MRIAMVAPYALDEPGGVQDQACALVLSLRAAGHDAWVVAPGRTGGPDGTVHLGGFRRVRTNRSVAPIRLAPGTARDVASAVAGADLVHIHEPFVPSVSLAALRLDGVPKVGTFHADPGTGVRLLYRLGLRGWQRLAGRLAEVVAVSPVAAAPIEPLVKRLRIIPNTIDLSGYRPDTGKDPNKIAFLGRDERRKGLESLLEAFERLRAARPHAELVVMGATRPPRPGVRFLGTVADDVKRRELATSAVFVAPNTGGESFGLVLLEALASGCAVVASALPAFRFVAGDAALYTPPGDPAALLRMLDTVVGDPTLARDYQERARRRATRFDRQRAVDEYLKVYGEAVDNTGE